MRAYFVAKDSLKNFFYFAKLPVELELYTSEIQAQANPANNISSISWGRVDLSTPF